jgi:hypothetical protein
MNVQPVVCKITWTSLAPLVTCQAGKSITKKHACMCWLKFKIEIITHDSKHFVYGTEGICPKGVDPKKHEYEGKNSSFRVPVRSLPVRTQRAFLHESPIKRLSVPL